MLELKAATYDALISRSHKPRVSPVGKWKVNSAVDRNNHTRVFDINAILHRGRLSQRSTEISQIYVDPSIREGSPKKNAAPRGREGAVTRGGTPAAGELAHTENTGSMFIQSMRKEETS